MHPFPIPSLCPFPYVQSHVHFPSYPSLSNPCSHHKVVIIPPSTSSLHTNDRHPTRINPLRTNPLDMPPASYKQQQPYLANHLAPAINLHNLRGLRCLILLIAVFTADQFLRFPYAPSAPPGLPPTDERGHEVPELFPLLVPAGDWHEPVTAL